MTAYLADMYRRLEAKLWELPDTQENYPRFVNLVTILIWIVNHPDGTQEQYLDQVDAIKNAPAMEQRRVT